MNFDNKIDFKFGFTQDLSGRLNMGIDRYLSEVKPPELPPWAKPSTFRFKKGEKDETYKRAMDYLLAGDEQGLKEVMGDYAENDAQLAFWTLFSSRERSTMNNFLQEATQ